MINPPLSGFEQAAGLKGIENVMQPLGIGYLAAILEKNNFYIKIIDARVLKIDFKQLLRILKKIHPDIIGITATVLEIQKSIEFSDLLKMEFPDTLLIIGGPHFTSTPLLTMQQSVFDIGVIGEGEYTFLEIVQEISKLEKGSNLSNLQLEKIKGIVFRDNGEIKFNKPRSYIKDLDALPFPARHLYPPLSIYRPVPASYKKLPLGHIMTSRGCPHQCIFCDRKVFGNRTRMRSPKNIVDELEVIIKDYNAKEIKFFDDTFTLNKNRIFEIFKEMKKRNLKFPWSCLTRVNYVDYPLLKAMKKAGCWQIAFGIESGDQRMLDIMKKGTTVEQNRKAVIWAKKAGLNVRAYLVLGIPGETLQSIRKTIDFTKSLPFDVVTFYNLTIYPGNELYEMIKREGKLIHEDYSQYNPLIDVSKSRLAFVPDGLTEKQLKIMILKAHKEFYIRISYILRQALSIRSWSDMLRFWRGFKAILNF